MVETSCLAEHDEVGLKWSHVCIIIIVVQDPLADPQGGGGLAFIVR